MVKYSRKVKVGMNALECRNRWISVNEIAYLSDVTPRQVLPALMQIPDIKLEFKKQDNCRLMLLSADDAEQRRIFLFLLGMRYSIPDIEQYLRYIIPYSGWVTLKDLAYESGIKISDLFKVVSQMEGLVMRSSEREGVFLHQEDVKYHV